ncbi:MAG TPA: hypothetical protein DEO80_11205, partial [Leclercia adecarboxylata]|nr:hypothetical protein [Leclercia adecarboxylata]
MNILLFGKTG